MAWHSVATQGIDFSSGVTAARADAICAALTRRALPILRLIEGRLEPLASAALLSSPRALIVLTCAHLFDHGVRLHDLVLPLGSSGAVLPLHGLQVRLQRHPLRDLACIEILDRAAQRALSAHWAPIDIARFIAAASTQPASARTGCTVVAGYPYAQTRRQEGALWVRPVVAFAPTVAVEAHELRFAYARQAQRVDGLSIHSPALDGVSGALCWSLQTDDFDDARQADAQIACTLNPLAVQTAFKHDAYIRAQRIDREIGWISRLPSANT